MAVPTVIAFFAAQPSRACSVATTAEIHSIPGCVNSACGSAVPRNAVFFESTIGVDGSPVALVPVSGEAYFESSNSLAVGAVITAGSTMATVGDFVDIDPPSAPELISAYEHRLGSSGGCGASSTCDGVKVVELEVSLGTDGVAAPSALTLLVYFGNSAADVAAKSVPSLRLASSAVDSSRVTIEPVASSWVAIETMDQAGNRSERTLAVQVTR